MTILFSILLALALDFLLGEPRRFHPLVGFGRLALALERRWHGDTVWRGLVAVLILLIPLTSLAAFTRFMPYGILLGVMLLYLAIGWWSLGKHALRVRDALLAKDLTEARRCVGLMVSRDTTMLDSAGVSKATVESVLENGNDAVFGAIFWYMVAGAPGVVLYRLANTLDAMWGYRNERYQRFGWAAARLDDVLNFIPARLTALSYALAGSTRTALRCWRTQGLRWKSLNAGPVMAAGAGSLGVLLGGPASYHGAVQQRPPLGEGRAPDADDIDGALQLIRHSLVIWLVALAGGATLVETLVAH
ncbi:MAG: adenosylcobinamide-phosphate synthase CbiB [Sulfuricaulis sp.]